MAFYTLRNMWARLFPPKPLTCRRRLWASILKELRERGRGKRESGGFLLGRRVGRSRTIELFLPYDVIDPNCLRGAILFDGSKMDQVWKECRARNMQVVADVHTHPCGYGQSGIDRANPMIPEKGHVALIVPNFADRYYGPDKIGIYEFRGSGQWKDHSGNGAGYFGVRGFA